jgi:predicted TIM-barrel fold metal-dependent hydrolase
MGTRIGAVDVLYEPAQGTCASPEAALAEMDAAGVAVAFVSQCKRWTCERQWMCVDTRLEDVVRYVQASVRFAGMSGYNPLDVAESLREMEAARALGFRGSYLHLPSFGLRLNDARLYPLFAKASELSQPAMVQVALAEPDLVRCVERITRDFPELSLALVHPRPTRELLSACSRIDRLALVLDTAALAWVIGNHRDQLNEDAVVERCTWGSNGAPLASSLSEAMALELPAATLECILRTNALRYFASVIPDRLPQSLSKEASAAER